MKKINKIIGLFVVLIIISIVGYYSLEGFALLPRNWLKGNSACNERKNCSSCLNNGYDNTGGLCYWCNKSGCINPDNENDAQYFNSSCTTDKKCF